MFLLPVAALSYAFLETFRGRGDIELYHRYAVTFWAGTPPLHHLPEEYPPLSLPVFSLSMLPPGSEYVLAFGAWMALVLIALLVVLHRMAGTGTAAIAAIYLLVGAFATLFARFDLVPALVTVLAVLLSLRGRHRTAYLLLGAGVLVKLYPIILVPLLAANQLRAGRSWRGLAADLAAPAALVAGGFALAAAVSPTGWTQVFTYAASRPIQVESVPATIAWIASGAGIAFTPNHSFHSYNINTPLAGVLTGAGTLVLGAGVLALAWRVWRGRLDLTTASAAAVLLAVLTGKVLSPQYLIWALPLAALAERRLRWVWLEAGALTTLIYPVLYDAAGLRGLGTPASYPLYLLGTIAVRNALLVAAAYGLLVGAEGEEPLAGRDVEAVARAGGRDEVFSDRDPGFRHRVAGGGIEAP